MLALWINYQMEQLQSNQPIILSARLYLKITQMHFSSYILKSYGIIKSTFYSTWSDLWVQNINLLIYGNSYVRVSSGAMLKNDKRITQEHRRSLTGDSLNKCQVSVIFQRWKKHKEMSINAHTTFISRPRPYSWHVEMCRKGRKKPLQKKWIKML